MASNLNPQFQQIGESFVKQYYNIFDGDRDGRSKLSCFYHASIRCQTYGVDKNTAEQSLMSYEGHNLQGAEAITDKFKALAFGKIQRMITAIDCQPMFDGGVLINILGQLKMDDDPVHGFTQVFALKPLNESFYIQHDMFRLVIHNT